MRKSENKSVEDRVLRWYRWAVAGLAAVLLAVAGIMTYTDNAQDVLQNQAVDASDIYQFSFVSQEQVRQESGTEEKDSDEVYYSDSFFERSNNKYDHELARASLALSMTTFKKEHVESLLGDMGYEDTVLYRYDQQNDEDKVAFAISHKYVPTAAKNIIAIAIRGGKYGDEWGSNGRVGYDGEALGYHYGFHMAGKDAIVQLKEYAADNDLDIDGSVIWITGFSRGAAVANAMGAMLTGKAAYGSYGSQGTDADMGGTDSVAVDPIMISPADLFCYTFASPSTVSESFVTENTGEVQNTEAKDGVEVLAGYRGIYNVVNPLDIVTRLPMNAGGISQTSKGNTVRYDWDYTKYGTILELPAESGSAQMQVVDLLENALAFATRNEAQYVEKTQDQVMIPALKKTLGKGADVSKRNVGYVLIDSLPGVTAFLKDEISQLDLKAQIYVAGILSGKKSLRLEKEHWPETYWGWMMKVDGL